MEMGRKKKKKRPGEKVMDRDTTINQNDTKEYLHSYLLAGCGRSHQEEERSTRRRGTVVAATKRWSRKIQWTMTKNGKKKRLEWDRQQSNTWEGLRWYLPLSVMIWKATGGKRKRKKSVRTIVVGGNQWKKLPQTDRSTYHATTNRSVNATEQV
jgi:hypothetical protein